MNRYQQRPQPKQPMTVAQSVTNLTMLLVGCTDARLATLTADELAGSYRVSPAMATKLIADQRAHRAQLA